MMPIKQVQAGRMSRPAMPNVTHVRQAGGHVFGGRAGKPGTRLRIFAADTPASKLQIEEAQHDEADDADQRADDEAA